MRLAALIPVSLALAGCVFQDVREQQARFDASCVIEGSASSRAAEPRPIVVVLGRKDAGGAWRLADHFVLEQAGRWAFAAPPGDYRVGAFEDTNRDLRYQRGEPFVDTGAATPYACARGGRVRDVALALPAVAQGAFDTDLDIVALQARNIDRQVDATLGQLTAAGEVIRLDDPRFARDIAESGMWKPFDFIVASYAGIYFLEPDDARKTPVLFVHGIEGTPISFEHLIGKLDRSRFQPWVYYYPTGVHLAAAADHLTQTAAKVLLRHPHDRMIVVAHSMGGLVSRGFVLRHAASGSQTRIPLFVTISTPWDGHRGAELGVRHAPAVVRVWEDMAPGSDYLKSLFARPLPAGTAHHMMFTHQRKQASFGASDDQAVTVASQLAAPAQAGATRLYGFDDTHIGILQNAEVSKLLNRLLEEAR